MCKRQCWSVWLVCSVTLLLVDLRTVALLQNDTSPRRCYTGDETRRQASPAPCPAERPFCGTIASTPDLSSSLVCAKATEKVCSVTFTVQKKMYQIMCVCTDEYCNTAFLPELRKELLNFTAKNPAQSYNLTDYTDLFFNSTKYANLTNTTLYQAVTDNIVSTTSQVATIVSTKLSKEETHVVPRAEALKHEATVPSDDDEDESEGSGSFEETRSQKRPASAPAAPSSFLPANENSSTALSLHIVLIVPLFLLFIFV